MCVCVCIYIYIYIYIYIHIYIQVFYTQVKIGSGGEGAIEDKMVGWHHQFSGHEFEQTLEDSEG